MEFSSSDGSESSIIYHPEQKVSKFKMKLIRRFIQEQSELAAALPDKTHDKHVQAVKTKGLEEKSNPAGKRNGSIVGQMKPKQGYANKKQDFKSKPKKKKEKEDKAKKQQQPKLKNDQDKENIPKSETTAAVKMPIKNSTSTSLMNNFNSGYIKDPTSRLTLANKNTNTNSLGIFNKGKNIKTKPLASSKNPVYHKDEHNPGKSFDQNEFFSSMALPQVQTSLSKYFSKRDDPKNEGISKHSKRIQKHASSTTTSSSSTASSQLSLNSILRREAKDTIVVEGTNEIVQTIPSKSTKKRKAKPNIEIVDKKVVEDVEMTETDTIDKPKVLVEDSLIQEPINKSTLLVVESPINPPPKPTITSSEKRAGDLNNFFAWLDSTSPAAEGFVERHEFDDVGSVYSGIVEGCSMEYLYDGQQQRQDFDEEPMDFDGMGYEKQYQQQHNSRYQEDLGPVYFSEEEAVRYRQEEQHQESYHHHQKFIQEPIQQAGYQGGYEEDDHTSIRSGEFSLNEEFYQKIGRSGGGKPNSRIDKETVGLFFKYRPHKLY